MKSEQSSNPSETTTEQQQRVLAKPYLIVIMLIIFCTLAAVSVIAYNVFVPLKTDERIIRIKQGETTKTIAQTLKANHIVRSEFWFHVLARLTKSDRQLKSGRYVFGGNVSIMQTIIKIKSGTSTLLHLTIPEGFSLYATLKQLEKSGVGSYDSLLRSHQTPN